MDKSKLVGDTGPNGYERLKKHEFFKGIDFEKIFESESPRFGPAPPIRKMSSNSSFQASDFLNEGDFYINQNYVPSLPPPSPNKGVRKGDKKKSSMVPISLFLNFGAGGSVLSTEEPRKLSNPDEIYSGIIRRKKFLCRSEVGPAFLFINAQLIFFVDQKPRVRLLSFFKVLLRFPLR